jgi:hypothetical protein
MSDELALRRMEIEQRIMAESVREKAWTVPAQGGKGPVTVALRLPEVRVTDSAGRHISDRAGAGRSGRLETVQRQ